MADESREVCVIRAPSSPILIKNPIRRNASSHSPPASSPSMRTLLLHREKLLNEQPTVFNENKTLQNCLRTSSHGCECVRIDMDDHLNNLADRQIFTMQYCDAVHIHARYCIAKRLVPLILKKQTNTTLDYVHKDDKSVCNKQACEKMHFLRMACTVHKQQHKPAKQSPLFSE